MTKYSNDGTVDLQNRERERSIVTFIYIIYKDLSTHLFICQVDENYELQVILVMKGEGGGKMTTIKCTRVPGTYILYFDCQPGVIILSTPLSTIVL